MPQHNLILTEKPSAARSIAAALGAGKKRKGYIEGDNLLISWCAGHLLELAAPEAYGKYARWRYEDLPIIPEKWLHIPAEAKTEQLEIIRDLMNRADVDVVINACDAGREGEHIFRLVYEYANCGRPTKRLWVSSMEEAAIRAGFDSLKDGREYDNLSAAASCRERADWCVGINATRAMTTLYGATLSAGRVQSPTLAMLVGREAAIDAFVKEPFYTPFIDCGVFTAAGERQKDRQDAEAIRAACDGRQAVVRSVERREMTIAPPVLFDLTLLQREANRLFGYTAQQTLDYAQNLYEKALLSYPRCDSKYLTPDMYGTAETLIEWIQKDMGYRDGADFVPDISRLFDAGKVSDHHAIILTPAVMKADLSALQAGEMDLLNLVACRLLCAAAPVHVYETVAAEIGCASYAFVAKGKTVVTDGWKEIERLYKGSLRAKPESGDDADDAALPGLSEGLAFENVKAGIKEGSTTPPKHYTEDTLLLGMETAGAEDMPDDAERKGLGTPATRAAIIEKLIKAGFVVRQKKNIIPTDKGKNLVAALPDTLTSPKLTAEWEHKLKQVERGELSDGEFMDGIAEFTKSVIRENCVPKPELVGLFGGVKTNEPIGSCPRCKAPVREGARGFFCDDRACGFKLWKESKFWEAKKKPLTAGIAAALLKDGRVALTGLYSEKSGKSYDAAVVLEDSGEGYVKYRLEFARHNKRG